MFCSWAFCSCHAVLQFCDAGPWWPAMRCPQPQAQFFPASTDFNWIFFCTAWAQYIIQSNSQDSKPPGHNQQLPKKNKGHDDSVKGEKNARIFFPQRCTEPDTKTSQVAPEQDEALFECMDPEPCRLAFNFIRNCFWHNSMAPKNRAMENQMLFQTSCTFILHIFPYFPISIPLCYLRKSSV